MLSNRSGEIVMQTALFQQQGLQESNDSMHDEPDARDKSRKPSRELDANKLYRMINTETSFGCGPADLA